MKKLNLAALLIGAVLFTGIGATTLSAEAMKCGAGKCGGATKSVSKCGDSKGEMKSHKCCDDKKDCKDKNNCKDKEAPAKAMKCGTGKCGSN